MNPLLAALGLRYAPALGMTLLAAFNAIGPDAVFGPGCGGDFADLKTVQAPARWRRVPPPVAAALGQSGLVVMAEMQGDIVRSVHLARQPEQRMSARACRTRLEALSGGAIRSTYTGQVEVFERSILPIANHAARYRALFRASREECRVMLTIGT